MAHRPFIPGGIILLFMACSSPTTTTTTSPTTADNSRNALDWAGTYTGITPCADCEGIQTSLQLNQDKTYLLRTRYMGSSDAVKTRRGNFTWNEAGNTVTLGSLPAEEAATQYKIGENSVTQLDRTGALIGGELAPMYVLSKEGTSVTNTYWKLIELEGKEVPSQNKEPHLILQAANTRAIGSGGCNRFSGGYLLEANGRLSFTQMVSTRMACPDMWVEGGFMKALQNTDSYYLRNDTLQLIRARMAPLAKLVAVYLR